MEHSGAVSGDEVATFDVVIVGAGISGISAAYYLSTECPDRTFTILEQRSNIGGTWDLFRYPGVRSDSDMHTLGFRFAPWRHEKAIAKGEFILDYLQETVDRFDLRRHISFGQQILSADWSSADACWTLTTQTEHGVSVVRCNVLFACAGYYSYKAGHTPDFAGIEDFGGDLVHPNTGRPISTSRTGRLSSLARGLQRSLSYLRSQKRLTE